MGRTRKSRIAFSSPANPAQLQAEKVRGRVELKLLIYLTGSQLSLQPGGGGGTDGRTDHLQRPRCKSQLNCQIPGTEPRAGGENPRWYLLAKSPAQVTLPKSPTEAESGARKAGGGGTKTETTRDGFIPGFA